MNFMNCVRVLVVAVAFSIAAPTLAKDTCLSDGSNTYIFKKVKKLKAGRAVSLQGIFLEGGGQAAPFDGSAMMLGDGVTVRVGVFVHSLALGTNNFTVEWTTTTDFTGTADFDNDGNFVSSGTLNLSTVDCKTVTIP
jgi:hypothetical protein